jgi:DNA-3-methyladenine glycosylase
MLAHPAPGQGIAIPGKLLPRSFFLPPPDIVAPRLLGKLLVRRLPHQLLAGRIVETEAYFGAGDPAAHSHAGKTPRNAVLFGPPGHAYVYFIYGMHQCLNVSCEPEGQAGCVLIRAIEPLEGLPGMAANRGLQPNASPRQFASGPGRLCQALAITRADLNAADMTTASSPLQLRDDGHPPPEIAATPRVGITKAADRLLRFLVPGNPFVSGKRTVSP